MRRYATIVTALVLLGAPAQAATQTDRTECNSEDGGDFAIAACTRVIEDRAQSRDNRVNAYVSRGEGWRRKGDFDRSIADLDEAIRLDPKYGGAYLARAYAWDEKGDLDRAIADYDQMARLQPGYAATYSNRGLVWFKKGDRQRALADITRGLRMAPGAYWSHTSRAIYDHLGGDFAHAIKEYDASLRIAPIQNAYATYGRGVAKLRNGDTAGGNADIAKAKYMLRDVGEQFAKKYGITAEVAAVAPAAPPPAPAPPAAPAAAPAAPVVAPAAPVVAPAAPVAAAPSAADCELAETHWQSVEAIDTPAAYQDHLDRFPSCPFATLAKLRIEALKKP